MSSQTSTRFATEVHPELVKEIKRIVANCRRNEQGMYVSLVKLGLEYQKLEVKADDFRLALMEAGLHETRASEIKSILAAPKVAKAFTDRSASKDQKLTVVDAIAQARGKPPGRKGEKTSSRASKHDQVVDAAEHLIELHLGKSFSIRSGIYRVDFIPNVPAQNETQVT